MAQTRLEKQKLYQLYRKTRKSNSVSRFSMLSPFQRKSIDLIDFSNETQNDHNYIIVLSDNFSRYMIAKPMKRNKKLNRSLVADRYIFF